MTGRRVALGAVLVLAALVLQPVLVGRLPLPGGPADLVLVVVVALALAEGALPGAVTGFAAGLLVDLDTGQELGRAALALTLVGYLAGVLATGAVRSRLLPLGVTALAAVAGVTAYAAEGLLLGDPRITGDAYAAAMVGTVPYSVVLGCLVHPLVGRLVRRLEPDSLRR